MTASSRPFIPLLLLFLYLFSPGAGLLVMGGEPSLFGTVDDRLVASYFLHAGTVFGLAYWLSNWRVRSARPPRGGPHVAGPAVSQRTIERIALALAVMAVVEFSIGGYDILVSGENRGEVRVSLGGLGFLYTWLQIYVTPFLLGCVAYCHLQLGPKVRRAALMAYAIGAFIGISSGYKFTTVLIFLPMATLFITELKPGRLLIMLLAAMSVVLGAELLQSGRPIDEAALYVVARTTSVAAYGVLGTWSEFADAGASWSRFVDSGMLWIGSKLIAAITGIREDSIEFLRFNLARRITYLYYPDPEGAISGTVNLTLTSFGEALSIFGANFFWVWSLAGGIVSGLVLRSYTRAMRQRKVAAALVLLVYFFTIVLAWMNSGGWVGLISLPVLTGVFTLRGVVARLALPTFRRARQRRPLVTGLPGAANA